MTCSIQIQSVLYNNEHAALLRSLDSIANALRVESKTVHKISSASVFCGDASPQPLLSEASIEHIQQKYADYFHFRYRYFNENTGFGKGHNLMGCDAVEDYLLIINPDIVLSPRFLISHLSPFHNTADSVGIVEGRQTPIEHPKEYDPKTGETDWASGACMLIPQTLFQELRGFDADTFFMYCEDVDISWRVRLRGKKIIYQPLDPIFHPKYLTKEGRLEPSDTEKYCSAEANLMMAYKWSNEKRLKELLSYYENSDEDYLLKAAAAFRRRQNQGSLPDQLDAAHHASTFKSTGEYTSHRFGL